MVKILPYLFVLPVFWVFMPGCVPEEIPTLGESVSEQFYLVHKGAQMPVIVEGNTASKTFVLVVHGGPGGNAMIYNDLLGSFSDLLERRFAMVYWDQRGSGNSLGNYPEELLTIDQYVEDLDVMVELLFSRYGRDSKIFLMGHSWGGTLTAAYLTTDGMQDKITGWIEVAGAHNFPLINKTTPGLLVDMGRQQIAEENRVVEWEEIVEYCEGLPEELSFEQAIQVNRYANQVETYLLEAGVTQQGTLNGSDVLNFYFFSNHNFVTSFFNSQLTSNRMAEELVSANFSNRLGLIRIPCLFLWGQYDFVVPLALGEDAINRVSTLYPNKSLHVFKDSGHSPMVQQPQEFSVKVEQFVEKYR